MQPEVSGIQPEARQIVRDSTSVFVNHLQHNVVSIVAHGSAVKGGYIAGGSDVDLDIFVTPAMPRL